MVIATNCMHSFLVHTKKYHTVKDKYVHKIAEIHKCISRYETDTSMRQ